MGWVDFVYFLVKKSLSHLRGNKRMVEIVDATPSSLCISRIYYSTGTRRGRCVYVTASPEADRGPKKARLEQAGFDT